MLKVNVHLSCKYNIFLSIVWQVQINNSFDLFIPTAFKDWYTMYVKAKQQNFWNFCEEFTCKLFQKNVIKSLRKQIKC